MRKKYKKVPLPNKKITTLKSNNYVFYVESTFRNDKGQPDNKRILIGKKEGDFLVPNHNYFDIFKVDKPEKEVIISDITRIGNYILFDKITETLDIKFMLKSIFPENYNNLLTIALYMLTNNKAMMYLEDYQEENKTYSKIITSQQSSEIFKNIYLNNRNDFFKKWIKKTKKDEYIAYDITSISSYATANEYVEYGYNRDGEDLAQVNLGVYFGESSKLPIYYNLYSGSINDKTYLQYMVQGAKEQNINHAKLVLDTGFFSESNLRYMADNSITFIICMQNINFIKEKIRKGNIVSSANSIKGRDVYGKAFEYPFKNKKFVAHVYYDNDKKSVEEKNLYKLIDKYEEELTTLKTITETTSKKYRKFFDIIINEDETFTYIKNHELIDDFRQYLGYFACLSNDDLSSTEVLEIYRKKDIIEKHYDNLKNFIDCNRFRVHSAEGLDGKIFINFISLICKSYIEDIMKRHFGEIIVSVNKTLEELAKIKMIKVNNKKRLVQPLTKKQKEILKAFDIKESDVLKKLQNL